MTDGITMNQSRTYSRFGLNPESLLSFVKPGFQPAAGIATIEKVLSSLHQGIQLTAFVRQRMDALALVHLGTPVPGVPTPWILDDLRRSAEEFFRGSWRQGQRPYAEMDSYEASNKWGGWTEVWRYGSLAASVVADREVIRLHAALLPSWAEFVEDEIQCWGGSLMWNVLAQSLASQDWGSREVVKVPGDDLRHAGKPHEKHLLRAALAVAGLDDEVFGDALLAYMTHFREKLWKPHNTPEFCSVEGTVLWHLARRRGMRLPDLAAKKYRRPAFKTKRPGVKIPLLETTLLDHIMFPDGLPEGG